jgi:FkbM family methyltransferase
VRKLIIVLALFATVASVAAARSERGRWRLEVLSWKATGNLPVMSWPEVVRGLFRCDAEPCIDKIARSAVTIGEFDSENPCPVLWKTPLGPIRGLFEDHPVLEHFTAHSWIVDPAAPRVKQGDIVLEVGAWLGSFMRAALNQGAALVVAMEPEPINRSCLEQTFASEIESGRVKLIAKAAWDRAGPVKMTNLGPNAVEGSHKGFAVSDEGPVDAEAITIDELVDTLNLERVDFLEMDIEGGESLALQGARRTLQQFRPIIVACIHHLPGDREEIPRTVLEIEPSYEVETTKLQGYFRPVPSTAQTRVRTVAEVESSAQISH